MKLGKTSLVVAVILLAASLTGCGALKKFTVGEFNGNTYTNSYFGLSLDAPEGWSIASQEEIARAFSITADVLNMDEETLKKQQTVYLAYMMKHPFGFEGYNANLNVFCVNLGVAGMLSAKTGTDYLELTVDAADEITKDTEISYSFGEVGTIKIDGVEFGSVDATMDYSGMVIKQRMLCAVKNKYAIVFVLSWMEEADLEILEGIIDTIRIK